MPQRVYENNNHGSFAGKLRALRALRALNTKTSPDRLGYYVEGYHTNDNYFENEATA